MNKPLTTLEAIKAELGISSNAQDSYLNSLILRASARLGSMCNQRFALSEGIIEEVDGHGHDELVLKCGPVVAVTSVERSGSVSDAASYEVSGERAIRAVAGVWADTSGLASNASSRLRTYPLKGYTVTYTAGYVTPQMVLDDDTLTRTLPYDVEEAVLALAVQAYHDKGVDKRLVKEEIMSAKVTYKAGSATLPSCVSDVVARYRRWS